MSKKSIAVQIAGHKYKILSEGDGESLREIASYVDAAMNRVRERTGTVDTLDIAVLTALNLAREIITLREEKGGAVGDARMRSLIERVELALAQSESEKADPSKRSTRDAQAEGVRAEGSRTLDLPSFEALRERTNAASGGREDAAAGDAMPEARVASGGRERAS